ncbi:hypothetical protein Q3G72_005149 [Acer saccharum]|nr:hypothetical protein Q3G72_005149 [Acer saccharum]
MDDETDVGDLNPKCLCGMPARHFTSWIDSNPGRHFWATIIIGWSDPPMCARSKVIIPRLLRRIRDLEMRSLETNSFEGPDTSVSPVVANEEVSSRGAMRRILWCGVLWL